MNNRLLVVATSGEVGEGARVFHAKVASHERGASGEGIAQSSDDPISSPKADLTRAAVDIGLAFSVQSPQSVELDGLTTGGAGSARVMPDLLTGGRPSNEQEITL